VRKTIEGVTFEVLPDRITATMEKGRGYAFQGIDLDTLTSQFAKFVQQAREHFGPRFHSLPGKPLDESFLNEIVAEATLYAMWLDIAHRKSVSISERTWEGVTTQRIVFEAAKKKWPRNKEKAAAVTAQLLGLTPEQYAQWREGEDRFQNR
jgi:hypothetical protein